MDHDGSGLQAFPRPPLAASILIETCRRRGWRIRPSERRDGGFEPAISRPFLRRESVVMPELVAGWFGGCRLSVVRSQLPEGHVGPLQAMDNRQPTAEAED